MSKIELIIPTKEYEDQVLEYKKEFELNGDSLQGCLRLETTENYDEWLRYIADNSKTETLWEGLVEATQYLAVRADDQRIVGMVNIRHRLNDHLLKVGGHVGYSVRKSERQKGYAKEMLRLALRKCIELNIEKALVTCDKDNIASAKTILANGGMLENEVPDGDKISQRYWIAL